MLRSLRIAAPAIAIVLALAPPAGSSTVVRLSNKDLADRADQILHGKCASQESHLSDDGSFIWTEYTLEITERLKGQDDGRKTFTFRSLGGVVGDRGYAISGAATFKNGEEVVCFLDVPHPKNGCRHTIGLAQGKFSVVVDEPTQEKFVERDLDGLKLLDPRTNRVEPASPQTSPRLRFVPFMNEIRGFVKK
jgi:hypothetical protein